jgi:hypothetical protein
MFNFWPGVAAGRFRALGGLVGVAAAADMEGPNNNAGELSVERDGDRATGTERQTTGANGANGALA